MVSFLTVSAQKLIRWRSLVKLKAFWKQKNSCELNMFLELFKVQWTLSITSLPHKLSCTGFLVFIKQEYTIFSIPFFHNSFFDTICNKNLILMIKTIDLNREKKWFFNSKWNGLRYQTCDKNQFDELRLPSKCWNEKKRKQFKEELLKFQIIRWNDRN